MKTIKHKLTRKKQATYFFKNIAKGKFSMKERVKEEYDKKCYSGNIIKSKPLLENRFCYKTTDICKRYIANLLVGRIPYNNFESKLYLITIRTNLVTIINNFFSTFDYNLQTTFTS